MSRSRLLGISLALTLLLGPLAGQAPMQRSVSDSALLLLLSTGNEPRTSESWAIRPFCRKQRGEARTACEALANVRAGSPARVPSRRVDPTGRIPGSEFMVNQPDMGVVDLLIDLNLGFPEYKAEGEMSRGRRTLTSLVAKYPSWGPGWYGLASAVLDMDDQPDSALALLARARASGDVPDVLVRFLTERAQLRLGRSDARDSLYALLTGSDANLFRVWIDRVYCPASNCPMGALTRQAVEMVVEPLSLPPWAYPILVRSRIWPVLRSDGNHLQVGISVLRQNLAFREVTSPQGTRFVYPLRVRIVAVRSDGLRIVQDSVRQLATAIPLNRRRQEDRGQIELRSELVLPPGEYEVGLYLFDEKGGGAAHRHSVSVPTLPGPAQILTFSAGAPGRGPKAPTDDGDIWLAPGSEWLTSDSVALFAQFAGLRHGTDYRVSLSFLPIRQTTVSLFGPTLRPDPAVTITATLTAEAEVQAWHRMLAPASLRSGAWCASLELREGDSVVSERTVPMLVELDYQSWPDYLFVNYVMPVKQECAATTVFRLGKEVGRPRLR